jgi:CO/xanthine dehydrogenase Mo-binding subunit
MIILLTLQIFVAACIVVFGTTEIILPAINGDPLFPRLRGKSTPSLRAAERELKQANRRLQIAQKKREAAGHLLEAAKIEAEAEKVALAAVEARCDAGPLFADDGHRQLASGEGMDEGQHDRNNGNNNGTDAKWPWKEQRG